MRTTRLALVILLAGGLSAFVPAGAAAGVTSAPRHVTGLTAGGGHYLLLDSLDARFAYVAIARAGGKASGLLHHSVEFEGEQVEFFGTVTCVTFDSVNRRAWVGGVVVRNNSTHPGFRTPIHEPGRDIWFRVLDASADGEPDRTTFVGFEGGGGIGTSEEYCATQIWPPNNDRTWPLTSGGIVLRA